MKNDFYTSLTIGDIVTVRSLESTKELFVIKPGREIEDPQINDFNIPHTINSRMAKLAGVPLKVSRIGSQISTVFKRTYNKKVLDTKKYPTRVYRIMLEPLYPERLTPDQREGLEYNFNSLMLVDFTIPKLKSEIPGLDFNTAKHLV